MSNVAPINAAARREAEARAASAERLLAVAAEWKAMSAELEAAAHAQLESARAALLALDAPPQR